mmetsp:Transcript_135496/g.420936  ORF Transcript_135496/g.420936 Transcript_135496/m.420936 type:complete len:218 (-) Transcript_135496:736-1389(-)
MPTWPPRPSTQAWTIRMPSTRSWARPSATSAPGCSSRSRASRRRGTPSPGGRPSWRRSARSLRGASRRSTPRPPSSIGSPPGVRRSWKTCVLASRRAPATTAASSRAAVVPSCASRAASAARPPSRSVRGPRRTSPGTTPRAAAGTWRPPVAGGRRTSRRFAPSTSARSARGSAWPPSAWAAAPWPAPTRRGVLAASPRTSRRRWPRRRTLGAAPRR